jgi:hypothetical protein
MTLDILAFLAQAMAAGRYMSEMHKEQKNMHNAFEGKPGHSQVSA